jgi:hypothetical protein
VTWRRPLPPAIPAHAVKHKGGGRWGAPRPARTWTPDEQMALLSEMARLERHWQEASAPYGVQVTFGYVEWYPFGKPEEALGG